MDPIWNNKITFRNTFNKNKCLSPKNFVR